LIAAETGGVEIMIAFAECREWIGDGCNPSGIKAVGSGVDICMKTSDDNGDTWGQLKVIATDGNQPTAVFDSVQERVILQFNSHSTKHNMQTFSNDLGSTWSPPTTIDGSFGNATGTSVGPGRGLQLSPDNKKAPNRLLFIGHHGAYQEDYVWYSDDGSSYTASSQSLPKMDEAQLVELPNGDVMANMRNSHANPNCSCRAISVSTDGALFFTKLKHPINS